MWVEATQRYYSSSRKPDGKLIKLQRLRWRKRAMRRLASQLERWRDEYLQTWMMSDDRGVQMHLVCNMDMIADKARYRWRYKDCFRIHHIVIGPDWNVKDNIAPLRKRRLWRHHFHRSPQNHASKLKTTKKWWHRKQSSVNKSYRLLRCPFDEFDRSRGRHRAPR